MTPEPVVTRIRELALEHPAYGCNRSKAMLALEGTRPSSKCRAVRRPECASTQRDGDGSEPAPMGQLLSEAISSPGSGSPTAWRRRLSDQWRTIGARLSAALHHDGFVATASFAIKFTRARATCARMRVSASSGSRRSMASTIA